MPNKPDGAIGANAYFVVFESAVPVNTAGISRTDHARNSDWCMQYNGVQTGSPHKYCMYLSALNDNEALFKARAVLAAKGYAHALVTSVEVTEDKNFRTVLKGA